MFVSRSTGAPSLNLPRDTNFKNTSLLIHGDGLNGANNTMFVDYNLSNKFVPFKGTSSYYFNGTTDNLNLATSYGLPTTRTPFTLECWVYPLTQLNGTAILSSPTGVGFPFAIYGASAGTTTAGSTLYATYFDGTNVVGPGSGGSSLTLNQWSHIALVYDGTTARLYLNGSISGATYTGAWITLPIQSTFYIGRRWDLTGGLNFFNGYISNVRLVGGQAMYSGNSFTPPTSELTYVDGTQILTAQNPISNTRQPIFKDNSPSNLPITTVGSPAISIGGPAVRPVGKPAPGAFTPYPNNMPADGWSNYFNGTSDYLTVSPAAASTGNFTMEFWLYNNNTWSSNFDITDGAAGALVVYFNSGNLRFAAQGSTSFSLGSVSSLAAGQWHHFVVVKSNGNIRGYADGVALAAAQADSTGYNAFTKIGGTADGYFRGYISNFRYVNNANIYDITSSTYTVPTQPLSVVANTQLSTSQSYRFIGANTTVSNVSITTNGNPSVQPYSPFAQSNKGYSEDITSGSIYFNGSTDYLTIAETTDFSFASNVAYTIEYWMYPTLINGTQQDLVNKNGISAYDYTFRIESSNLLVYYTDRGPSTQSISSISPLSNNQWYHVATTFDGTNTRLFLNGLLQNTSSVMWVSNTYPLGLYVGARQYDASMKYSGYISDIRILKGEALYTSSFTPPSTPVTATSNTSLLLKAIDAGIIDNTGKNNIATVGTSLSSTQSKFGGTSMYFDGSTSAIVAPYNSAIHAFHLSDFTVEMWIYPLSYTGMSVGLDNQLVTIGGMVYNGSTNDWSFGMTTAGLLKFYYYNGAAVSLTSSTTIPLNTWSHIAAVKTSSGVSLYYNGTLVLGPTAISGTPSIQAGTFLTIGAYNNSYMNAYLDDVRISKVARYTSNFTPPARKFEDR
jgi:hypothetical protein